MERLYVPLVVASEENKKPAVTAEAIRCVGRVSSLNGFISERL